MRFRLEAADPSFVESAPCRYVFPMRLAASADEVWAGLVADQPLAWVRGLTIRWTSPRPFGIGSTRTAAGAFGAVRLEESFFRWEDGHRYTFGAVSANAPTFRRFAEDYVVEPDGAGCLFTWTFAVEPRGIAPVSRGVGLVQRPLFAAMARDTERHFGTV